MFAQLLLKMQTMRWNRRNRCHANGLDNNALEPPPHLAVHAVSHAAVAGNGVAEVLNLEAALEARREEAAEGRDDRRKHRQHHCMQLHRYAVSPLGRTLHIFSEANHLQSDCSWWSADQQ